MKSPDFDQFIGESGSAILVSFAGLKLAFMTWHEISKADVNLTTKDILESALVPSLEDSYLRNLPIKSFKHCTEKNDEEYLDVVCFECDESNAQVIQEAGYFYSLAKPTKFKLHKHFYVGYPRVADNMTLDSDGSTREIKMRCSIRDCKLDVAHSSNAKYFSKYSLTPSDFPMDGVSGGAVFALIETEAEGFEIILAGIITRANSEYLHAIEIKFLISMAESF